MLLYYCESENKLFCRLLIATYLKAVWSLEVHKSSVDELSHSDKDTAEGLTDYFCVLM